MLLRYLSRGIAYEASLSLQWLISKSVFGCFSKLMVQSSSNEGGGFALYGSPLIRHYGRGSLCTIRIELTLTLTYGNQTQSTIG